MCMTAHTMRSRTFTAVHVARNWPSSFLPLCACCVMVDAAAPQKKAAAAAGQSAAVRRCSQTLDQLAPKTMLAMRRSSRTERRQLRQGIPCDADMRGRVRQHRVAL